MNLLYNIIDSLVMYVHVAAMGFYLQQLIMHPVCVVWRLGRWMKDGGGNVTRKYKGVGVVWKSTWEQHGMGMFSALLALCEGDPLVTCSMKAREMDERWRWKCNEEM